MRDADSSRSPAGREAARKAVHIAFSLAAATVVWMLPPAYARGVLAGAALIAVTIDVGRLSSRTVSRVFRRTVGSMLRADEARRLTGATMLAFGFALASLIAPLRLAGVAFLYAGLADPAAAAVGRRFGRHRTRWGKSLEGTAACFATALAVGLLAPGVPIAAAFAAALVTAAIEAAPGPDNLSIPIAAAIVLRITAGAG